MKKTLLAGACCLLLLSLPAAAQWQWLNPKPNTYSGKVVRFVDANNGFILQELGQLLRTTDAGATWQQQSRYPDAADLDFSPDGVGYLLTRPGVLWRSADGGRSWGRVSGASQGAAPVYNYYNTPQLAHTFDRLHAISADTVVEVATDGLVRRSTDGGRRWQEHSSGVTRVLSSCFVTGNLGFLGTYEGKIHKTVDGGRSWTKLTEVNYFPSEITMLHFVTPRLGFAHREHSDLLRTTDGGTTWTLVSNRMEDITAMHFLSATAGFAAGDYGTIYSTADAGASWTPLGPATTGGLYYGNGWNSLWFTSPATGYVTGRGNNGPLLRTTNGGQTWLPMAPMMGNIQDLAFPGNGPLGYAVSTAGFLKTTDNGDSWTSPGLLEANTLACPDANTLVAAGTGGRLYRSVNGGTTWATTVVPGPYNYILNFTTLSMVNGQVGFAGGSDNGQYYTIARTTDGGQTWQTLPGPYNQGLRKLDFVSPTTGFATGYGDVFKTTDGGLSWQPLGVRPYGGPSDVDFVDEQVGYVIEEAGGVYKTTDGGRTWVRSSLGRSIYSIGHAMRVTFLDPSHGCVQTDAGSILRTSDGGRTWLWELNLGSTAMAYTHGGQSLVLGGANGMLVRRSLGVRPLPFEGRVLAPTALTDTTAVLSGLLRSTDCITDSIRFDYGPAASPGFSSHVHAIPTVWYGSDSLFAHVLGGLQPATSYRVRLRFRHNGAYYFSPDTVFTTLPRTEPPVPELRVYPNPTAGYLRIEPRGSRGPVGIELFSLQGTRVYQTTGAGLDLSSLPGGIYILRVTQGKEVFRRRIMKL